MNIPCSSYGWLAHHLVESGFVAVTYDHVESPLPGFEGFGPGLDVDALRPGVDAAPCSTVLHPLLESLKRVNNQELKGCLDLNQVVLFGHSAGGTSALFSAGWFPEIRGVATYGAHAGVSTMLGHPPGTVLPVHGQVPTLLIGGDADGVVKSSSQRYGTDGGPTDLLERTFTEALKGTGHGMVILRGGQHLMPCHPFDPSLGRGFLEPNVSNDDSTRALLADLLVAFTHRCTGGPDTLEGLLTKHEKTITQMELM